ncbi:hypothetical protein IL306_010570 [Fusarium sp. DS 682]|nr:hypothetical protein IL306_010570 [Fusarium sp. DS 682]
MREVYKDRCKLAQERVDWNNKTKALQNQAQRLISSIGENTFKTDSTIEVLMDMLGEVERKIKANGWYELTDEYKNEDRRLRMMEKAIKVEYDTWLRKHLEENAVRYSRMREEVEKMVPKDAEIIRRYVRLQRNNDEFKKKVARIVANLD